MAKKKNEPERKPDLNESVDQADIEARISEMMEIESNSAPKQDVSKSPASPGTPIKIVMHDNDEDSLATAPELPSVNTKKPLSIKVVDHNESEPVEVPEKDPDLLAAIEEANQQILSEDAPKLDGETDEKTSVELPEEVETQVEDSESESADSLIEEQEPEAQGPPEIIEEDKAIEPEEPESSEQKVEEEPEIEEEEPEPEIEPKEKPLKHLDSIVPKTKTIDTLESIKTEEAVEDIISKESDALLMAEDEKLAAAFQPEPKPRFGQKLKAILGKKWVKRVILVIFLATLAAIGTIPSTRYFLMNTAGVRSAASLTVLDNSTQQPLKGVKVTLAGQSGETDQNGRVELTELKLGSTELIIEKRAFATTRRDLVLGWGSNQLNDIGLTPTGSQYSFVITDYLSGKPIVKATATSNEANARVNEKGEIRLTIDQQDDTPRDVTISAEGYRDEKFALNLDQKEPLALQLVPARKHVFISNRKGRFDVYKVDVDGKNEALVLPGTGSERDDMVLITHPTDELAALVSTRDNKRNADGFLLSTLTVLNLSDSTTKSVVTSERVQIVDWVGSRIVYVQVKDGASGVSPDRHKLVSYDYKTGEFKELASSNYFNDVMIAGGKVYYAPSSTYSEGAKASLVRVSADGTNQETILSQEVWNIFRTNYDKLTLAVQQQWYEIKIGEIKASKLGGEPPSQTSRIYIDSPDSKKSLWVEIRDGKGVLLAYNSETKQDDIVRTQGGLKQPVRWLTNNTIVYRINTESETADYALNLDGGEPKKIRDVTNTSGVNNWYFY